MRHAVQVALAGPRGDDRASVFAAPAGCVAIVADGAGGLSGGADAAQRCLEVTAAATRSVGGGFDACQLLVDLDAALVGTGETTAVLVEITESRVRGASVGDSEAWWITNEAVHVLTGNQHRKPLLGSGRATVVPFSLDHHGGVLLIGSDGLFKYVRHDVIVGAARSLDLVSAAVGLIDAGRLRGGGLQDDVAVVLVAT